MKQKTRRHQIKKWIAVTTAVLYMTCFFSMFGVSANNYTDTDKTYSVGSYNWLWTDTARKKTDYTSSYQKCISSNVTYYSCVYGSNRNNPKSLSQLTVCLLIPKMEVKHLLIFLEQVLQDI